MDRRWLISAMAAPAVLFALSGPALADDKVAEEVTPAVQAEAPAAPAAPVAESPVEVKAPEGTPEVKSTEPVKVALGQPMPVPPAPEPEPAKAPKFTYGGTADFYFSTGFNNPGDGLNGLGVFDFKDEHGPHMNYAEVWAQYARDPIGFRLDLMWGPGGRIVNFFERTISGDDIWDHVEQAYVSVNLNKKGTTYLDFGRYVTPHGAEVIEAKDNWLYSRGILFGWAIPFTHFGARIFHYTNATDYISAQVNTGWDRVSFFDGAGPTFGIGGAKAINSKLTLAGNYMGGEEPDALSGGVSWRNLVDIVATYNASSKWAYTGNLDIGEQDGSLWYGFAAQAKYAFHPKQYVAARAEVMHDEDGVRFGTDGTAYGFTLNYTYLWNKHLQTRVEYRHDFFSDDFFLKNSSNFVSDQGRFIVAAILSY